MEVGDMVRCVNASPMGSQLVVGREYVLTSWASTTKDEVEDRSGVRLEGLVGIFRADRFEVIR